MTSRTDVAATIDHTPLASEATPADVDARSEAKELGVLAICVSRPCCRSPIRVSSSATVVGFPSGQVKPEIKAAEAKQAVADGAPRSTWSSTSDRPSPGLRRLEADIRGVVEPAGAVVKVIIESAALTDEQIVEAAPLRGSWCRIREDLDRFHPAGGASAHAVSLMRETVGDRSRQASGESAPPRPPKR